MQTSMNQCFFYSLTMFSQANYALSNSHKVNTLDQLQGQYENSD